MIFSSASSTPISSSLIVLLMIIVFRYQIKTSRLRKRITFLIYSTDPSSFVLPYPYINYPQDRCSCTGERITAIRLEANEREIVFSISPTLPSHSPKLAGMCVTHLRQFTASENKERIRETRRAIVLA